MDGINFTAPSSVDINFAELGINLVLCIVASFLLRHVYVRRSISLSGKYHIGTIIPILACVTFLVIMVVKSSLALSLGLVGALSVIRFRTPIKEPEELVYLFLSIALGLGYGAGQTFVTTIVFFVIVLLILFWLSRTKVARETDFNVHIDWTSTDLGIKEVVDAVSDGVAVIQLQKHTSSQQEKSVFLKVSLDRVEQVQNIVDRARALDESIACSFYEARPLQ